ncbi:MAG TPA: zinc-binding alcohol dehydrogenase [Capsulimonadaceae bacterium]|jgi:2-desacetyl-2-hydroxyethyl bacteriochlorophyllide A dehydrogenase
MTSRRIMFTGKQELVYEEFETPVPAEGEVLVRHVVTLMSTGTENIVFNRQFDAGTHWDNWVKYPFPPGYSAIGEIIALGNGVSDWQVGDRVAFRGRHCSHSAVPVCKLARVPDGIEPRDAAWFALAKIAFMGVRGSNYFMGDSVLIIGAGPIGQMSVRWAAAAGLEHVVVCDPVASRLDLAISGGATAVIAKPVNECRDELLGATGGILPRVVSDATGNAAVFDAALALVADEGRVVILGDTGSPASQHLSSEVMIRGLTIVGAHDGHSRFASNAAWNDISVTRLFYSLIARNRISLDGLVSHVFDPSDAARAYDIANTRRGETMGILFDWAGGGGH